MTEARATPRAQQISATAVFADLVGFAALARELGTERAYLAVTPCLRMLDEVVRKHGGSVDKYAGDKLLGVFGYPLPLPGHAEAAARAALEMKRRVAEYAREMGVTLDFHAGLNSGELVAGDIRGPVVREFHVLGDVVNTAARLNAKTLPGEIFVGEATWQQTHERLSYRALPPFQLKGKKDRVPAYALLGGGAVERGRLGEPGSSVALVARQAELASLREVADALAAGRPSAAALIGPEGSGKSRLFAELAQGPALKELRKLQLQCAHVGGEARELAATELASAVLGRELGSLEEVAHVLPELAEATRARPLALALEDVDRLSAEAAESLQAMISALGSGRLLLLLSTRDRGAAGYARMAGAARRLAPLREIELPALAPADAAGLLETLGLDAETRALVQGRSGGLPGRLLLGAFGAAALRSERDLEAREEWRRQRTQEAERRRVAVLFADISGFTAMTESQGAERAYPVVAGALHLLEEIARKYGGTVDHFLGDCVMALFGVPEAIEDAPRAAVNAAIEIRERIETYNDERDVEPRLAVHSGIATGLAITGDISGPLIREYAVMGEHVDRGDEFCHEAERGEIYVDAETHRFTSAVFDYAEGRPVSSRDEPEPLPSYAVRSRQTKLHRERIGVERRVFSALVGREAELAALGEALSALEAGRGSIVQLIAEAGVGKSRLVTELEALAAERGIGWLEGRSLSTGRNLAYHPFADLLRSWAGTQEDDDAEAERARVSEGVRALLPELASDVLPFLLRLQGLALGPADERRLAEMPADALERMTRRAVQEVVRGEARRQPLVLVMDDLHWADASSIELLEATLRQVEAERLLLLIATRPGWPETAGRIQVQVREKHPDRNLELTLLPLGAEAVRRMVRNLFPGGGLPYATRTLIEERARGNPFYIEEVVRALADQGAVEYRGGAFHATRALESAEIPGTVQEVVMARIDRLAPERKRVLQAAAVVGGTFHAVVLEAMGAGGGALDERLSELCDGEFLVPTDRTRGVEYAFKHPLLQEVTYDSLLETRRQALHREAGEAIEKCLLGTAGVDAMLAYHFGRGLDPRAEEYLFRAGDEAARSAASSEALHFFEEASALYFKLHGEGGDPEKKARLESNVAQALFNRGREPDAVAHFDGALTQLGVPPARNALAMNLGFVRDFALVLARLYLPFGSGQHAATEREREVIRLMFQRALAQTTSDPTRFLFDSVATMRRIVQVDERSIPSAGRNYAGAVGIFSYGGISFGIGRRFLDRAGELLEGDPEAPDYLYYRAVGYIHHFLAGDWSEAHEVPEEVVERHLHAGRLWEANAYWSLLAEKRTRVGDFEGSRATLQRLYEIGDSLGYQDAQLAAMGEEAFLLLEQGRFDEAIAKADDYYEESPQDMLHVLALGVKAKAQLRSGALEEAEASLARADAILAPMGLGQAIPFHVSFERTARLAAELVRYEAEGTGRASKRLGRRRRAALANARQVAGARPEVFRLVGREAFLRGARRRALRAWERSLWEAERLGIRTEQARTLHEVGLRVGPVGRGPDGRTGAECLVAARDSYRELHLNDELGRLDQGFPP